MPDPRVIGATPLDLWLRSEHPQGVPASTPVSTPSRRMPVLTDFARLVVDPEATTSHRLMDPDRDPRFIATGRAATAAMTCGKVSVLTSTPIGCRTSSPPPSATHKGSLSFASADPRVIGATPLDPRLWSGHPGGVQPRPRSCGIGGRGRSVRAGVLCAVRPVRRYGAPGERAPARGATPPPPSRQTADPVATISSRECRIPEGIPAPSGISNIGISDFLYRY